MSHNPGRQLALSIKLPDHAKFDNYVGDRRVVDYLRSQLQRLSGSSRFIYIWGDRASGRTHLLQASCREANQLGYASVYLPMSERQRLEPAVLTDLSRRDLVCFDDVEAVAGQHGWEEALFHFLNEAKDSNTRVLMSGRCAPAELPVSLADLKSRLTAALVLRIEALSDSEKKAAIVLRAKNRGIELSEEVAAFILTRASRDTTTLFGLLDELDRENVHQQRRITIPFVKEVLRL
jgi:DnaA family protein|tara:strand:+ start:10929 stop:11633 length:705 start_codon:yes stop_codon:yes gene_type:complete